MNIAVIPLGIFGHWEVIVIVLVVVLIFGGKRIPELFKGMGQGMKEFKKAVRDEEDEKGKNKSEDK